MSIDAEKLKEQLKRTYESTKLASIHLGQQIEALEQEKDKVSFLSIPDHSFGASAEILASGVIRVTIPDIPPSHEIERNDVNKEIRRYYAGMVANPIRSLNFLEKIKHAVVLIVYYYPNYVIRDGDNRAVKPLLDGIRYSRIIEDDNWKYLSFTVCGELDKQNPRTELYLFDLHKNIGLLAEWLKKIKRI
ncbi:hypothetical protein [Aneurinibacillus thermoaerophilus]|uniref:hypothetical protein n=1 Tax=Aneurinibacillus thermoaerophilus TaxID=143495 RepID=UPI002E21BD8B|nr:hypothetical protein [Aneurinibacillus thermoaerophilus]